jgi:hypothetical protein
MPRSDFDATLIGGTSLTETIGSLGDISTKSLAELSGEPMPIDHTTSLTRRATTAWNVPLGVMTCEQLRLLVGQAMGLDWLASIACLVAVRYPNATVTLYPGDLTLAILRSFPSIAPADPEGARRVLAADRSWLRKMKEVDEAMGGSSADEAASLFAKAEVLAGDNVR